MVLTIIIRIMVMMMRMMRMIMLIPQAEVKEAESAGRITSIFNSFAKALSRPASKVSSAIWMID